MFISKNEHSNPFILFLFQKWIEREENFRFVMFISAKKTYSLGSTLESGGEIQVKRRWRENCIGKQYWCGEKRIMKMSKGGALQVKYERLDACAGSIIRRRQKKLLDWRPKVNWFRPLFSTNHHPAAPMGPPMNSAWVWILTEHARWSI